MGAAERRSVGGSATQAAAPASQAGQAAAPERDKVALAFDAANAASKPYATKPVQAGQAAAPASQAAFALPPAQQAGQAPGVDAHGMLARVIVTAGPVVDCTRGGELVGGTGADNLMADRGHGTDAIVEVAKEAGMAPVMPFPKGTEC